MLLPRWEQSAASRRARPRRALNSPATCTQGKNMTQDLLVPDAAPELWKDNIWDRLLDSLDERSVIPIVGPDLLQVEIDGTTILLDQYIARRLALIYKLPADDLPAERPLNHVVCQLFAPPQRPLRHLRRHFPDHEGGGLPALQAAAAAGGDHRFQPLRLHDVRLAAGEGDQRGAVRRRVRDGVHRLLAQEGGRPARPARRSSPSRPSIT